MYKFIPKSVSNSVNVVKTTIDEVCSWLAVQKVVQLDTETTGLNPNKDTLLCIQVGNKDVQYVIEYCPEAITRLKPYLEDSTKLFILHNAKFDYKFLFKAGIRLTNIYDTMLAELVLTGGKIGISVSLKSLLSRYLGIDVDKTIRDTIATAGLTEDVIHYSATDVMYLQDVKDKQYLELVKLDLLNVCELENKAALAIGDMEVNGMKLDTDKWLEIAEKAQNTCIVEKRKLNELANKQPQLTNIISVQANLFDDEPDYNINWSSPSQVKSILHRIGIYVESTEERHLIKYKAVSPLVASLLEYRKQSKLITSFGADFLEHIDSATKRIHPDFRQIVSTGRMSCRNPNLLNIPRKGEEGKKLRSCFVPKPGYKVVGGDFSGMELRIIAEFSRDPLWISAYKDGKDLHSELAMLTFGIPLEDVTKPFPVKPDITYRDVQKTINFGLAYGMSHFKLAETLNISEDEAKALIDKFFEIVPDVRKYLDSCGNYAKANGFIRTAPPYKRIRWFEGYQRKDDMYLQGAIERKAKNAPIQGSNADIIKEALVRLRTLVYENNYPVQLINSIYDEILTECKEDFAEEWLKIMTDTMINSAQIVIKSIPVKVDCKISNCWTK